MNFFKKLRGMWRHKVWRPVKRALYEWSFRHFPRSIFKPVKSNFHKKNKKVAYYVGWFPVLSETFIQREVLALRQSLGELTVFADDTHGEAYFNEIAQSLKQSTNYIYPPDENRLKKFKRIFRFRHPVRYFKAFLFVRFHRFEKFKSSRLDKEIFEKAIYLAGHLFEHKITHVHSPWANRPAVFALVATKLLNITFSVQGRASADLYRKDIAFSLKEKFKYAAFIITNSQFNVATIQSHLAQNHSPKIHQIYEGIDLSLFRPKAKKAGKSKTVQVLTVARIIEAKGLTYLLKACALLKKQGVDFNLKIIGGTAKPQGMNYYVEVKKLYHVMNLSDCIDFAGTESFSEIIEAYQKADIFVLPSVVAGDGSHDITPNVLIEAMAMKLPVIASNLTAVPEIIEDGISGLLVPPRDEIALANSLNRIIEDKQLRQKLGENARKKVEQQFDINKNILKYVNLFKGDPVI